MSEYNYEINPSPVSKGTKTLGLIGMIVGIVGLVSSFGGNVFFPIAGLVISSIASKKGEVQKSKIGKLTSIIGLIISILAVFVWFGLGIIVGIAENF
ncbi:MAG: hypothetical protein II350_03150 [Clostridia bacterium]|nr:hypothetical protein [Clostridia bacterium]